MNKDRLDFLVERKKLRIRNSDIPRIKSLIDSAKKNAYAIKKMPVDDNNATIVFREIYESIRQLGDAKFWSMGYEPLTHDVSMEILKEMDIKESIRLKNIDRFRRTRNNSNYRGYMVSREEALDILDFWDNCADEIIRTIRREIKN